MSTAGHGKSCGKLGRPRSKAKYLWRPIADKYREGKVKSPPVRGVKEYLKPCADKRSERRFDGQPSGAVMACLLKNEPASASAERG